MTNKQLSPAAQAVMVAATNGNFNVVNDPVYKQCIAAALRAAADQVVPENANAVGDEHDDARYDQWVRIRYKILAIANELEGK
jgi:hypothetical protein